MVQIVKSTCGNCQMACGILISVEDNRPLRIDGDPDHPVNKGALCIKGQASLELLYNPSRIKHPLKREGRRGEGKWRQITWDEAIDTVAAGLNRAKDISGAESVIFIRGSAKGLQEDYLTRFGNIFGSPNIASMAQNCFMPRRISATLSYGYFPRPDYEYPPSCLILWGMSPFDTRIGEYRQICEALNNGMKLIVVDPRQHKLTDRAELWLQLRPGSDLALALGMIRVIISEELYDKDFVDRWTVGFDQLKDHVQGYPPEKVAEITWVPAETIKAAARSYASHKPACIQCGNGIDMGVNSLQNARASDILRAITGNLGVPGGELEWSPLPISTRHIGMENKVSPELRARRISAKDSLLPTVFYALPHRIVKAILYGDPYPIRVAYIQGCNPLLTYSHAKEVHRALNQLEFLVVSDMFMTPTAAMADIVFPAASFLEFDSIHIPPYYKIASVQQKVAQVNECRSDYDTLKDLAKKLGLEEHFYEDVTQFLDSILAPAHITFDEFRKIGVIKGNKLYKPYLKDGFQTPSGKVELYSSQLEKWNFDPLPTFYENPETPLSDPELTKDYPLVFTSWKPFNFQHSRYREIPTLRGVHPEPVVHIHPQTAVRLGIRDNDWVYIETKRGRIKQKAILSTDVDPRVVGIDYGWWFPENNLSNPYDWAKANVNILTNNQPPFNREMGSPVLRGILCKVYRVD